MGIGGGWIGGTYASLQDEWKGRHQGKSTPDGRKLHHHEHVMSITGKPHLVPFLSRERFVRGYARRSENADFD